MKNSVFISILVILLVGVGYLGYLTFHHGYVQVRCPDCDGTGKASCGASGCLHGMIPCANADCLQLGRGGVNICGLPATWIRNFGTALIFPTGVGMPTARPMSAMSYN